MENWCFH